MIFIIREAFRRRGVFIPSNTVAVLITSKHQHFFTKKKKYEIFLNFINWQSLSFYHIFKIKMRLDRVLLTYFEVNFMLYMKEIGNL